MNRISRTTMRRLSPRTTVISGAALGLIAGVAVYGAVSSSAQAPKPAAYTAKAPAAAQVSFANCAASAKLDKGVCVVQVVKTVVVAPSAAGAPAAAVAGATPNSVAKPASAAKPAAKPSAAKPATAAQPSPAATSRSATSHEDDSVGATTAALSPYDAALLAAKDAAAVAAKDTARLGANNPTTVAANKAAKAATAYAATLAPVRGN